MENIWVCKKCSEEVESTFDICWNCNADKNGSNYTFEDIREDIRILDEQLFLNIKNMQIAGHKIIDAGRSIKSVVRLVIIMILLAIIASLTTYFSEDNDTITTIYLLLGIASLICNIIILILLYSAGDNLENSIYKKVELNNTSHNKR